jgi:anti-sigma regulatory factor (Ser/Thr protein kinase)
VAEVSGILAHTLVSVDPKRAPRGADGSANRRRRPMTLAPPPAEPAVPFDGCRTILLPHAPASVGAAREQVRRDLLARGIPADLVADTVLIVSEIVSNALKHAQPLDGGKVRLRWSPSPERVLLEVTDGGGATRPRVAPAAVTAGSGRGLAVVGRLSRDWGVREASPGSTVWAVVDLDARSVTQGAVVARQSWGALRDAPPV